MRAELKERYPGCETTINFLCGCNSKGELRPDIQLVIGSSQYMLDFIKKSCDYVRMEQKMFAVISIPKLQELLKKWDTSA